jgi:hypothetical protein
MRILLDPVAGDGGGEVTPEVPTPNPAPAPAPEAKGDKVQLSPSEYAELVRAKQEAETLKAKAQADRDAAVEAERQKHLKELIAKGEVEKALKLERDAAEEKAKKAVEAAEARTVKLAQRDLDVAVKGALAGFPAVDGESLLDAELKLRSLVTVEIVDGEPKVRFKDGKDASVEDLKAIAEGPRFSHFRKATSQGGSGSSGGDLPAKDKPVDTSKMSAAERAIQAAIEFRKNNKFSSYGM